MEGVITMKEEWKPLLIDQNDTGYKISNLGNVKDSEDNPIESYTSIIDPLPKVDICIYNIKIPVYVDRLVAIVFIPNTEKYNMVNHINGDRIDSNATNLEWIPNEKWFSPTWSSIINACKLLECPDISYRSIQYLTGLKYMTLYKISRRQLYANELSKYKFPRERKRSVDNNTSYPRTRKSYNCTKRNDITEGDVHTVCKMLLETDYSVPKIARTLGLRWRAVHDIAIGHLYYKIAKDYGIPLQRKIRVTDRPRSPATKAAIKWIEEGKSDDYIKQHLHLDFGLHPYKATQRLKYVKDKITLNGSTTIPSGSTSQVNGDGNERHLITDEDIV